MSIAEHATATLYFEGVSRALTHELIRHRHLSYSQLSQRFVDEADAAIVIPPAIRNLAAPHRNAQASSTAQPLDEVAHDVLETVAESASETYAALVDFLTNQGLPRKQAREAARAVLPNMVETRIVVTGNLRAWHEVIQRRTQPDA
ncbi:FAD-dependent thymidylate synthase, partial [Corynebacterium striatum]|uniref:FAD-dependent thymidylate synthase n=1 Tax=Corynebacterium striatum TaxID=43770 RepID=UPI0034D71B44